MPHAAIFWCNYQMVDKMMYPSLFQCRTRQFSGAIAKNEDDAIRKAKFQCRTRQFSGAMTDAPVESDPNVVSMPHAAIFWCNNLEINTLRQYVEFQCRTRQFSGAIFLTGSDRGVLKRFNAARGNFLVQ